MDASPPPNSSLPAPGWYRDPSGEHGYRWWDGSAWTSHVSSPSAPGRTSLDGLLTDEQRFVQWARLAVIAYVFIAALNALSMFFSDHKWRSFLHAFRVSLSSGATASSAAAPSSSLSVLLVPMSLAAVVVFLMFQYKAARVARVIGYPARRSPRFGIWCWFIPIVALWMPYQALRDLLPVGHPRRRFVLYGWLSLLLSEALTIGLIASLEAGVTLRSGVLLLDLLDLLAVAVLGVELVHEVAFAHHHDALSRSTP